MIVSEIWVKMPSSLQLYDPATGGISLVTLGTFLAAPYVALHANLFTVDGADTFLRLKCSVGSYTQIITREEDVAVMRVANGFFLNAKRPKFSFEFTTKNGNFFIYQLLTSLAETRLGSFHSSTVEGTGIVTPLMEVRDYVNTELALVSSSPEHRAFTQRLGWFTSVEFTGGTVVLDVETNRKLTQEIKFRFEEAITRRMF